MTSKKEIFLKDYQIPAFDIKTVSLDIDIQDDETIVWTKMDIVKNDPAASNDLVLDGKELELLELHIDDKIRADGYIARPDQLIVENCPDNFVLQTKVRINPDKNLSGEGLYRSGNIYCTQCEAHGFRRITYFLDRPDVMSMYQTTIRADKKKFPFLLSNGNKISAKELNDGRHEVTWKDPHRKPCYLFAAVAGDLAVITDEFHTKSGRPVQLEIYTDHVNKDKCDHAMNSLKNSMKWDEDRFGLEYDLDIYMIVAVDSFNMGAMENKGLNIFNSSYVLANPKTATDSDFQGIESVIGHEYFHNWTGNRVTCRDWFQLTLKEGLTVFRDQEFSSDMLSRPVKRIEDVQGLKAFQFNEDSGPLSHPIKPKSYIEINNFYTATVYEKGAEVIRMIHTLLGEEGFRKGMDLYFTRHDGQAVTTEDFVQAMADANDYDFDHFKVWYDQNGTPELDIETDYDEDSKQYTIKVKQKVKTNNPNYNCLYLPFYFALYSNSGEKLTIDNDGRAILNQIEQEFVIDHVESRPIPSFNTNFSAPVKINYKLDKDQLAVLMANDLDPFNQFNAVQKIYRLEVQSLIELLQDNKPLELSEVFKMSYEVLIKNIDLDASFKALCMSVPKTYELLNESASFDFEYLPVALSSLKKLISDHFQDNFLSLTSLLNKYSADDLSKEAMGERALKNATLALLAKGKTSTGLDYVYNEFKQAENMTQEFACLRLLCNYDNPYRDKALNAFYDKWRNEPLVMQKWLSAQATALDCNIDMLTSLENDPIFDKTIPNNIRALYGSFAKYNLERLNDLDGSGYRYIADKVLEIDPMNPQIAAGLCKTLNFLKKLDPQRQELLKGELKRIIATEKLSSDTYEVASKNLSV